MQGRCGGQPAGSTGPNVSDTFVVDGDGPLAKEGGVSDQTFVSSDRPTAATDTKARILDAAEALFSAHGFAATSMRDITTRAEANLAAVNYHFGSKLELVRAVFARRFGPLNEDRLARLTQLEARAGDAPVALVEILRAFVAPALRLGAARGLDCMRLMGRVHSEPPAFVSELFGELFADVRTRFLAALQRGAPHLPPAQAYLRMYFVVGAMAHTMVASQHLAAMTDGQCDGTDLDWVENELVHFGAAGLLAKPTPARRAR